MKSLRRWTRGPLLRFLYTLHGEQPEISHNPDKETTVGGKKASRPKESVARTRRTQCVNICLPRSMAGLELLVAADKEGLDSNIEDHVVLMMP